MSAEPQKYFFNVDQYYRMAEVGLFSEGPQVELIEGEVIDMSPIGSRDAGCVDDLNSLLTQRLASFQALDLGVLPILWFSVNFDNVLR